MTKKGRVTAAGPGNGDDGQMRHRMSEPGPCADEHNPEEEVAAPSVSADIARFAVGRLGVTQAVLARRIGVSQSYISRVLRGEKNLAVRNLEKLAIAMEMPLAVMIWQATLRHRPKDPRELEVNARLDELIRWAYPERFRSESDEGSEEDPPTAPSRIWGSWE